MKCPRCHRGNPAAARFCLNCGAELLRRCSNCETTLPAGARFCMHCGQPTSASTPADSARLTHLVAAAPVPLIEKVHAAAPLAGERRLVTVLFVDVVGATALVEQMGAEAWTEVIEGAFERVTPAIYRYEGTIARLLGDALWAFFGAPVAHEDDPARAVYAALDLLKAAHQYAEEVRREHGTEFAMRACLNTGPVVVGPVGDDLKYSFTAMGDTVNLASRFKFAAQPMTVLISEETHGFVAPLFDCADLGSVEVKGRTEPVRAYRVSGARTEPGPVRGLPGLDSPMVGRDAELTVLLQLSEVVRAGLGRAALVIGEPGLGKTRLVAEWKASARTHGDALASLQWAEGRGLSYGQGLPYRLVQDLLRSLIGVPEAAGEAETGAALLALAEELFGGSPDRAGPDSDELSPTTAVLDVYPYLGHLLSLELEGPARDRVRPLDPEAIQAQYLTALRKLLQALSARRPLALVVEDLHWADPSSIELLIKLLPLASTAPVLFCLTTRPYRDAPGWKLVAAAREILGGSLTELTLGTLSETDSRRLVTNLLEIEALPEGQVAPPARPAVLHRPLPRRRALPRPGGGSLRSGRKPRLRSGLTSAEAYCGSSLFLPFLRNRCQTRRIRQSPSTFFLEPEARCHSGDQTSFVPRWRACSWEDTGPPP